MVVLFCPLGNSLRRRRHFEPVWGALAHFINVLVDELIKRVTLY